MAKLTFPRSKRYWHLVRQSGELVKVDRALSAAFRVAVSVASYNCLQRRSSCTISFAVKSNVSSALYGKRLQKIPFEAQKNNFFPVYLFLHFCFGTRRGQVHVACAWKHVPLMTSYHAGSEGQFWRER